MAGRISEIATAGGTVLTDDRFEITRDPTVAKLTRWIEGADISAWVQADFPAASLSVVGKVELATIAETDTGTDATRALTPAGLKGSALQTKVDGVEALADVTDPANVAAAGAVMDTDFATLTAKGIVELATTAEMDTGTDTGRAMSINEFAASDFGTEAVGMELFASDAAVTTGDGTSGIPIPASLDGYNIIDATATVNDKGITGAADVQVRRRRAGVNADVLSTKITLGDEFFASDGVVDTANDDVNEGDIIYFDVDAIHSGTPPNGLSVVIMLQKP